MTCSYLTVYHDRHRHTSDEDVLSFKETPEHLPTAIVLKNKTREGKNNTEHQTTFP